MSSQLHARTDFSDRGPAVFIVTTVTLAIAATFVTARLFVRAWLIRRVSWDDYLITAACCLAVLLGTVIGIATKKGLGRHEESIDPGNYVILNRCTYIFSIVYNLSLMATKTSILVFYLRLSANTHRSFRLATWATISTVNVAGVIVIFLVIFRCKPIQASFEVIADSSCIPLLAEFISSGPVNIITDLVILVLPIPILTELRLPRRQKTLLVMIFAVGIFVTVIDVVRIYYLQEGIMSVSTDGTTTVGEDPDFFWNAALSFMWSAVEVNISIICACIPTLKTLIIKILPAIRFDSQRGRSGASRTTTGQQVTSIDDRSPEVNADRIAEVLRIPVKKNSNSNASGFGSRTSDAVTTTSTAFPYKGSKLPFASSGRKYDKQESAVYFGFITLGKPIAILEMPVPEAFRFCTVVTITFLLWGFSYGLLDTLNRVVASISHMTDVQTLALRTAYFGGGYFFGPLLVSGWLLRYNGSSRSRNRQSDFSHSIGAFKAAFITGLGVYAVGTITFWPSAALRSFPGFLVSSCIIGLGLSILESAANPFLALCGPIEYSEMRLLTAYGFQSLSGLLSGFIASNVFEVGTGNEDMKTLLQAEWTYLAITLFCVGLALFIYYIPLPEVRNADLMQLTNHLLVNPHQRSIGGLQLRTVCIALAFLAGWTYTASQESVSIFASQLLPAEDNSVLGLKMDYWLLAQTFFVSSQFIAAWITYKSVECPHSNYIPRPRTLLAICTSFSTIFAFLTMVLRSANNPSQPLIPLLAFYFTQGPLWPLIFAIGLRGQGNRTAPAAPWLTMGRSGAGIWPFVIYAIKAGTSVHTAFIVVVALLVATLAYPVSLIAIRDAGSLVDPVTGRKSATTPAPNGRYEARGTKQSTRESSQDSASLIPLQRLTKVSGGAESGMLEKGIYSKESENCGSIALSWVDQCDDRSGTADDDTKRILTRS